MRVSSSPPHLLLVLVSQLQHHLQIVVSAGGACSDTTTADNEFFRNEHVVTLRLRQMRDLACVQDVRQDADYTQLTVLAGLLQDIFAEDL